MANVRYSSELFPKKKKRPLHQTVISVALLLFLPVGYMGAAILPWWLAHLKDEMVLLHSRITQVEQKEESMVNTSEQNVHDVESYLTYQNEGNSREGILALIQSSESGYPPAEHALARLYAEGKYLALDLNEALRLSELACASDIIPAYVLSGDIRYARGEFRDAYRRYKKAYELGNHEALYRLAAMEEKGEYVPKCPECAAKRRREAEEIGVKDTDSLIRGAPISRAIETEKAASMGDVEAMMLLAGMLFTGEGVAKDTVSALRWYENAARKGNVRACESLAAIHENGLGGQAKNRSLAADWYVRAARLGSKGAWEHAAQLYEKEGKTQDAKYCFDKAGISKEPSKAEKSEKEERVRERRRSNDRETAKRRDRSERVEKRYHSENERREYKRSRRRD